MSDQQIDVKVFDNYNEIGDFVRSTIASEAISDYYNSPVRWEHSQVNIFYTVSKYKAFYSMGED